MAKVLFLAEAATSFRCMLLIIVKVEEINSPADIQTD